MKSNVITVLVFTLYPVTWLLSTTKTVLNCFVTSNFQRTFKEFVQKIINMDCAPNINIFRELQVVLDTGYFSGQISPEEDWQQVSKYKDINLMS